HGRAHRMAALAERIPEDDRTRPGREIGEAEHLDPLLDLRRERSCRADSRQVAFDVCDEHGHPGRAERVRDRLERHGLARAGRAADETVPVAPRWKQANVGGAGFGDRGRCGHAALIPRDGAGWQRGEPGRALASELQDRSRPAARTATYRLPTYAT